MIRINIDSPIKIDEEILKEKIQKEFKDTDISITRTPVNEEKGKRREDKKYNRRRK